MAAGRNRRPYGGFSMSNCAIVGINWGDEGKGRMVDLLTEEYDVVIRYQGGGNAGHTVINECGKFAPQEPSPTPQFKSINSLALSFLHNQTLSSIRDHWKNHSLD